jgi:hypothetical protein
MCSLCIDHVVSIKKILLLASIFFVTESFAHSFYADLTEFSAPYTEPLNISQGSAPPVDNCGVLLQFAVKKPSLPMRGLPRFVSEEIDVPATENGPNCYNTVLRILGRSDRAEHVDDYEMVNFLRDETSLVPPEKDLRKGDLIVIWVHGGENFVASPGNIRHAAYYLGNGYVLHKASQYKQDPLRRESVLEMLSYWEKKEFTHRFTIHRPH